MLIHDRIEKLIELLGVICPSAGQPESNADDIPRMLIFVNSDELAERVYTGLNDFFEGSVVSVVTNNLDAAEASTAVGLFKDGISRVMVATDVLAFGMEFAGVECVINFELPGTGDLFTKRAGRCGRLGNKGTVISFFNCATDLPMAKFFCDVSLIAL